MGERKFLKYSLTVFFLFISLGLYGNVIKDDVLKSAGARASGMGGAFTSVCDDYSSFYWNPAGLVFSERVSLNFLFDSVFSGNHFNYGFNYTHPVFSDMTLAGTYLHTSLPGSAFSNDFFYATYATYLNSDRNASAGINLKFINISTDGYGINGFAPGIDIGAVIIPGFLENKIRFGVLLQDIDTVINWTNDIKERVPAVYRLGVSYSFDKTAVTALDLYGIDQMKIGKPGRFGFQAGAEKWFIHDPAGNFGFRAGVGWREARDPNARYTAGISYGRDDFTINYVYIPGFNNFGETHKIDFSYLIGAVIKEKALKETEPLADEEGLQYVKDRFKNFKFDISQKYFSPDGNGVMDTLTVNISGIPQQLRNIEWKFEIFNGEEEKIKEFKGRERIKERIIWDGMKSRKEAEKDGDYTLRYSVFHKGKVVWQKNRTVSIDTVPPRFKHYVSPRIFAPHRKSKVKEMTITVAPKDRDIKEWRLQVKDSRGNVLRKMSGEGLTEKMGWGGEDALGNTVRDGKYSMAFVLTDFAGNANELIENFSVDTQITDFDISPDKMIFKIGSESISFTHNMRDASKVSTWELEIRDFDGKFIRSFSNKSTGVRKVAWDGTDENNRYARPGSVYRYLLNVSQKNGIEKKKEGVIQSQPPDFEGMGIELTLAAVDFPSGSDKVPEDEYAYLNQAADAVKKYAKNYYLFVKAYASDYKDSEKNLLLSIKRALAVKDYLVNAQKVPEKYVYVTGYGDGEYFDVSVKNEIQKSGRRVEIELMTK